MAALATGGMIFAGAIAPVGAATSFDPTTLSIHAAPTSVNAGQAVTLTGTLTDQVTATGAADQSVVLFARPTGTTKWAPIATATTDAAGAYTQTVNPTVNADFLAAFYGTSNLGVSSDGPVSVTVTPLAATTVTIAVDHQSLPKSAVFHISTTVSPNAAGHTARLQVLFDTTWGTVMSTTLSAASTATFALTAGATGTYSVRVFVPAPDSSHANGVSSTLTLTVT